MNLGLSVQYPNVYISRGEQGFEGCDRTREDRASTILAFPPLFRIRTSRWIIKTSKTPTLSTMFTSASPNTQTTAMRPLRSRRIPESTSMPVIPR